MAHNLAVAYWRSFTKECHDRDDGADGHQPGMERWWVQTNMEESTRVGRSTASTVAALQHQQARRQGHRRLRGVSVQTVS